ncbi:MAG: hypothetical protein DRO67_02215 [Candidatus Asgardarchaeum californiense]|nr:MAG: hypothetical protein DRO67_02215 [Candidatus Asgardarchaeum californiense]
MMKICIFIDGPVYPYVVGGAEIFAHQLAQQLSNREYEVHLIGISRSPRTRPRYNYYLHLLPSVKFVGKVIAISKMVLHRFNCDVVLSIMGHSATIGFFLAKMNRIPHIIRFAGEHIISIKDSIYLRLGLLINSHALYIALAESMKKKMVNMGLPVNRILVIPNPIDDRFYKVSPAYDTHNILYVGRLERVKGIDMFLKSFLMVKKAIPDSRLIMVGNGDLRSFTENFVRTHDLRDSVILVGKVPFEEIDKYFNLASLFVLPSRNEALPNALLQAMAAGLPIVATKVGSVPDIIVNKKNGILVPPANPRKLADAVVSLLSNKNLAKKLGKQARKDAEKYKVNKVVDIYEKLFQVLSHKQ